DEIKLEKNRKHTIEVVVDRIVIKAGIESRLSDSLETALKLTGGTVVVDVVDGEEFLVSENLACPGCGFSMAERTPRRFSFSSPRGAGPTCDGLGMQKKVDEDMVIPDKSKALKEGVIDPWGNSSSNYCEHLLDAVWAYYGIDPKVPFDELRDE